MADKIVATGKECFVSLGFGAKPRWGTKHASADSGQEKKPDNVCYLYCISEYPTEFTSLHLPCVFPLHPIYDGFSDHTLGLGASLAAVSRGATVIEKHFTLNKAAEGFDHICSIDPSELADLVKYSREIAKVIRFGK